MSFVPLQNVSVNASIFTLTAIAVDRYKAIVYPLSNHASKQRTKVGVAASRNGSSPKLKMKLSKI
jgi:7 transmembrane receptor (rhodopsin family)